MRERLKRDTSSIKPPDHVTRLREPAQDSPTAGQRRRESTNFLGRFTMQNIRCSSCSKLLGRGVFKMYEIKCPRCKVVNKSAMSANKGIKTWQNQSSRGSVVNVN